MKDKKDKIVVDVILSLIDSLQSHLDYSVTGPDKKFHAKCVRDYAVDIVKLSQLL